MKFLKGVMFGTMLSAGLVMMYVDSTKNNKKKWMKQGKKMLRKMDMC